MEDAYDLTELNKYLDFIHLMSYDYHGKWDNVTGANAPLHSSRQDDTNTVVSLIYFKFTENTKLLNIVF